MIWRWSRSRRDDRESLARRLALATAELTVDLELSGLLGRIVRSASELVEADVAGLVLLDRDGPVLAAIHGMPEEYVGHRYEPGEGAIWTVLETGEPLVMAEIREHLRLPDMVGREGLDLHSGVVVPTKVDGQPLTISLRKV